MPTSTVISPLLDRLNRWADNLPCNEPIPIHEHEKFEVAESFSPLCLNFGAKGSLDAIDWVLNSIDHGTYRYRGHLIHVLKERTA